MRLLLILLACFVSNALADDATDQEAIRALISALNDAPRPTGLFSYDSDGSDLLARLLPEKSAVIRSYPQWFQPPFILPGTFPATRSQQQNPSILGRSIYFLSPDVAIADAVWVLRKLGELQTRPLLLILKRVDSQWKIVSFRELAPVLLR